MLRFPLEYSKISEIRYYTRIRNLLTLPFACRLKLVWPFLDLVLIPRKTIRLESKRNMGNFQEMTISQAALLLYRDLSQDGDIIQCLPGTKDYCRKGVFGDGYGELGFLP